MGSVLVNTDPVLTIIWSVLVIMRSKLVITGSVLLIRTPRWKIFFSWFSINVYFHIFIRHLTYTTNFKDAVLCQNRARTNTLRYAAAQFSPYIYYSDTLRHLLRGVNLMTSVMIYHTRQSSYIGRNGRVLRYQATDWYVQPSKW